METHYNKFKNIFLPILEEKNSVVLFLSGGLNSAVCAYCMMKISQEHNLQNQFKLYNIIGSAWHNDATISTKNYLDTLTGFEFDFIVVDEFVSDFMGMQEFDVKSATHLHVTKQLLQDANNDVVIRFATSIPEPLSSIASAPERAKREGDNFRLPVFDLNKDSIVSLALELNLENLIATTKTCQEEREIRCGVCFKCQERAWAFEQVGVADPGIM